MVRERKILKSWKEVASYLGVGIRTAQRWKDERGLPIRQPSGAKRSSAVLAVPDEVDRWLAQSSDTLPQQKPEPAALRRVNVTDTLWRRNARPRQLEREVEALIEVGRSIALHDRRNVLYKIASYGLELCKAQSSGFSILETGQDGTELFRWTATCGHMKTFEGGTTPADFSPCGVCLERDSPQLFQHPERYYTYLEPISPIPELLLVPMYEGNRWIGTVWVVSHGKRRLFDLEDARLMMELGTLASAVLAAEVG